MTYLSRLSTGRQATVTAAGEGCWDGTTELLAAVVQESRRDGAWKPYRGALLAVAAGDEWPFMTHDEFRTWRTAAKGMARALKRQHPREELGFTAHRYNDLGNQARCLKKGLVISKVEALACAHYAMGYDAPCSPEGLKAWFWPRFGQLTTICNVLGMDSEAFSSRISGYIVSDGVRSTVVAEPTFIRALDWVWRNGPVSPYGARPVQFFPGQDPLPRSTIGDLT